jgi:carbamoyl-phosphate synthase large subunit
VPTVDEELLPLARHQLAPGDPGLLLPPADFVAGMLDKLACARALTAQGLTAPRTEPVSGAAALAFPLILKPRSGRGSRGVVQIDEAAQVPAYLALHRTSPEAVIAQELATGQEYTVFVLADQQARLRAVVPVKVLEKRGVTIRAHTEASAAILDYTRRFQAAFRPTGPYNIQCMLTPAGVVLPFEVNPRVSTTFCLSFAAGVDAFALYAESMPDPILAAFQSDVQLGRHWHNHFSS